MLGPVRHNYWWQADTEYDVTHICIDWQAHTVTCPHGQISSSWTPARDGKGHPVIKIKFSQTDCKACPGRTSCTGQTRRTLTLQPQDKMQALLAARKRESTDTFKESYRHRAGIEGTHSQGTRTMGLRRSRYFRRGRARWACGGRATLAFLKRISGILPLPRRSISFT